MEGHRVRAVIFDLDGTLIDSAPDIHAAANAMLKGEGVAPLDLATITSFIGNGLPKLVERAMQARQMDMAQHSRLTEVVLGYYNAASSDLTVLYPNLRGLLDRLKTDGYRMGVCTNKPLAPAEKILRELDLDGYFDVVIGGDSLPQRKPDPAPLRATMDRLGATQAVYVGDSEVDAETARAANVPFALFTEGYRKTPVALIPHQGAFSDFQDAAAVVKALFGDRP